MPRKSFEQRVQEVRDVASVTPELAELSLSDPDSVDIWIDARVSHLLLHDSVSLADRFELASLASQFGIEDDKTAVVRAVIETLKERMDKSSHA